MAHWATALTDYARSIDPSRLPPDVLVAYDDRTLTICDMYPKAQYHYLVLPRIPFSLTTEEQDEVERTRKEEGERKELWGKVVRRPDEGPSAAPPEATKAKQPQQQRLNLAGGTIRIAPAADKRESQVRSS
ncbi:hypothetical protein BDZ90DRAFT_230288 [Jaminaea rosea]|uniref:HIT domain-containing protein n=1 Tax=Jaminaea rosea TaxID=1569628 RepID=A0A316UW05_9BASI|nr:hypothetical protein BDZ90DRAFT_230288 [Jaminaea rosea]PWN29412.1 hypothetical protein BDZ90DRAFT_230288 [Jaminaea rosea]